ncbi:MULTISPECIES: M15 family metallopeptidase [unclassified Gemella]|uniref:M15 family metallopeptidase n=1 Tax=unclassified Gemella TaxID=2624949 RepID=UPI001C54EBE1|nr:MULTISPECIES: M15 family metallopeptidase [unclassified Gemella]
MKKFLTLLFTIAVAALATYIYISVLKDDKAFDNSLVVKTENNTTEQGGQKAEQAAQNEGQVSQTGFAVASDPNARPENITEATIINGIMLANKKYPVPATFAPGEDPTALAAVNQLITDAQAQALDISSNLSAFRSYEDQETLYNNYVAQFGQEQADTFAARPGYSEHQLGLAFDLLDNAGVLLGSEGSSETNQQAAKWLEENAHKYGFIVRYKAGFEEKTGYQAEAWHIRYVGPEVASEIYSKNITLEEYLNVEGGTYNN